MKFSTKTTYGLRAIICLAQNSSQGSVSLSVIAKEKNISLKYLERLFSRLKKASLIKSEKGASGGYKLIKKSDEISVYEIIEALEGKIAPFHCLEDNNKIYCSSKCNCQANMVLNKIQESINQTLKKIKLSQLL